MSVEFVAGNRTGLEELKNKSIDYFNLIEELQVAIPYQDNKLKKQLLILSMSLTDLLEILENYE